MNEGIKMNHLRSTMQRNKLWSPSCEVLLSQNNDYKTQKQLGKEQQLLETHQGASTGRGQTTPLEHRVRFILRICRPTLTRWRKLHFTTKSGLKGAHAGGQSLK